MGFGAGQHLQHREQAVEAGRIDPPFLFDERLAQHRDLRHRAAESQSAEAQKFQEQRSEAELRGGGRGGGSGHINAPSAAIATDGADLDGAEVFLAI